MLVMCRLMASVLLKYDSVIQINSDFDRKLMGWFIFGLWLVLLPLTDSASVILGGVKPTKDRI